MAQGETKGGQTSGQQDVSSRKNVTFGAEGNALLQGLLGNLGYSQVGSSPSAMQSYNGAYAPQGTSAKPNNIAGQILDPLKGTGFGMSEVAGNIPFIGGMFNNLTGGNQLESRGLGYGAGGGSGQASYIQNQNQAMLDQIAKQQSMVDALAGPGAQVDKDALLNSIRNASDSQTQVDIAQGRSKFYNAPVGRNEINLADTVSRNAAARDAALASTGASIDQFNAQQQNARQTTAAQAALQQNPMQQYQMQQTQQLLQALGLLAGSDTGTSSDTRGAEFSTGLKANLFGGICWVAREVFGDDNKWKVFRLWLLSDSPSWFFKLYEKHGEAFAEYIKDKPLLKSLIRHWMNKRISTYEKKWLNHAYLNV